VTRLFSIALLLLCALPARAGTGADKRSDKRAEAKGHYENGLRKFDLGKYDEAAEEFEQAYDLVGEPPNILYNIAQAYRLAEKFEKSAQFYRSFLRKVPDVPNRAEIEGRIAEMDERAADLKRQADRRAAEQREADRKAERNKPPAPADKPTPQGPEPPPRDTTTEETSSAHPGRTLKIVGYALCGLTGAALATGIAMTVLTLKASDKVEGAASTAMPGPFTTDLHNTEHKGQIYEKVQIVGYTLAGAAAVGAGLAIYFGFRAEKIASWENPSSTRRRDLAWPILAPAVDAHGGGLVLEGRF
jgi:tetratricopeptide (TPR) repeat protein